jgi:hypothetical protein
LALWNGKDPILKERLFVLPQLFSSVDSLTVLESDRNGFIARHRSANPAPGL